MAPSPGQAVAQEAQAHGCGLQPAAASAGPARRGDGRLLGGGGRRNALGAVGRFDRGVVVRPCHQWSRHHRRLGTLVRHVVFADIGMPGGVTLSAASAPPTRALGMAHTPSPGPLVALRGLAPCLGAGLTPAKTAAIAVAAVAAAAQDDLHAASRAQVQAGGLVHAHPGTTEVLDGLVPARHTAAAPPSSARCRARYGRQACRQSDRCRAHLLRHRSRCTAPCHDCRRTASTASAPLPPSSRPAPARPPCRAAWLARIPSQPGPSHSRIPATTTTRQNRHLTGE